ncbi:MAG: DM13 domain-containing protein [Solirubrobacterales bacterium]
MTTVPSASSDSSGASVPIWARLLAIPLVVVITLFGLWVAAGQISNDFAVSMVLGGVWLGIAFLIAVAIGLNWRPLAVPVIGTYLVTAGVVSIVLFASTFTDNTVDENIATAATPAASGGGPSGAAVDAGNTLVSRGDFVDGSHPGSGVASIIELEDGTNVLTFEDFETDNGPDLRVYLVSGTVDGGAIDGDFVDLAGLSGNIGNQQYELPPDLDPADYNAVSVWCRAFSVNFTNAELQPA